MPTPDLMASCLCCNTFEFLLQTDLWILINPVCCFFPSLRLCVANEIKVRQKLSHEQIFNTFKEIATFSI